MWLVSKQSPTLSPRTEEIPADQAAALRLAYAGIASPRDEADAIRLVQRARTFERWIACDCRSNADKRPLLAPAYLTTTETYYLKRLTGPDRLEHDAACAFHADRPDASLRRLDTSETKPLNAPDGLFAVLPRLNDPHFAAAPDDDGPDRTAHTRLPPMLARQLWRLLTLARRNIIPAIGTVGKPDLKQEFAAIANTATTLDVAPGIALSEVLAVHPAAFHSKALFARLHQHKAHWPPDNQPQGFMIVYATAIGKREISFSNAEPIQIAGSLQAPTVGEPAARAPYLAILAIAKHPEAHGFAAVRCYAQPILSATRFVPVNSPFERQVLKALIDAQWALYRSHRHLALTLTRPLFDIDTVLGPCRPDLIVDVYDRQRHSHQRLVIDLIEFETAGYLAAKAALQPRLACLGPVISIAAKDLAAMQADIDLLAREIRARL